MKALQQRLEQMRLTFTKDFIHWADATMSAQARTMVNLRVVKKGEAPDGAKFTPYSTKPILVGAKSFVNKGAADKVFGSKKKRRELEWFTVKGHHLALLPGGYKQIRQLEGKQTAVKSFLRTGEMWKSIHVLGTKETGQGFTTEIGTMNDRSIKILEGNNKREGKEILMLSKKEEGILQDILDKWITNRVNKALNG